MKRMKNWLIVKLGGFTRKEIDDTACTILSMATSYENHAKTCKGDESMKRFYFGKQAAFESSARTIMDLLR